MFHHIKVSTVQHEMFCPQVLRKDRGIRSAIGKESRSSRIDLVSTSHLRFQDADITISPPPCWDQGFPSPQTHHRVHPGPPESYHPRACPGDQKASLPSVHWSLIYYFWQLSHDLDDYGKEACIWFIRPLLKWEKERDSISSSTFCLATQGQTRQIIQLNLGPIRKQCGNYVSKCGPAAVVMVRAQLLPCLTDARHPVPMCPL